MSSATPRTDGFRFHRLSKPEELRAAEELQGLVPVNAGEAPAPVNLLRAVEDHGGIALGAFADIHLAGLSAGFLGFDGKTLYHFVHRFVVRPEYQNHGVGLRLALGIRDEVRRQGLESIRGTFDPLQSRAAFLVFHRLGATADRYRVHHYGQLAESAGPDRESDRIEWRWAIGEPAVEERLARPKRPPPPPDGRFSTAPAVIESEPGDSGLRLPTGVTEPSAPTAEIEIPFDIDLIRQHEPEGARRWRHAVRDAFRGAFDLGYSVAEFDILHSGHERRSHYLLVAPSAGP